MTPVGFEPAISAGEQQTYVLDRAVTGTGDHWYCRIIIIVIIIIYLS
jgi:hypothetical protein